MAESQKGVASTADLQNKSSLLDDEIGKEFFSSWKSMSVTADDAMDFDCESVPKSKKKAFNFDKLDMDFTLDGDFDKISSFKVDMSDLDFSSPAKKTGKPKDGTEKETIKRKLEVKQDRFSFSFDFDELNKFDLDSSLMKGEKKSDKNTDDKRFEDSSDKDRKNQGSRSNVAASTDAFEVFDTRNVPTPENVTTSKSENLLGNIRDLHSINDGTPSMSAHVGNINVLQGETTYPEKKIAVSAQESDHYNEQLERSGSTELYPQHSEHTIQNLSGQSASNDGSIQKKVLELQADICSSDSTSLGGKEDLSVKPIASLDSDPVNSHTLKCSLPIRTTGLQYSDSKFEKLENQNNVPMQNVIGNESSQDENNIQGSSATSISQKMLLDTKATREKKYTTSKLLLAPLQRVDKLMLMKEKGNGTIDSKFLNRLEETESQLHLTSKPKETFALGDKRIGTARLNSEGERRKDFDAIDVLAGNQKAGTSNSLNRSVTEDLPLTLRSEKNEKDYHTSGFQVHPASLPEQTTKSSNPSHINSKLAVSSMSPMKSSKIVSVERKKLSPLTVGRTSDISNLKVSRNITSKNTLSNSVFQKEIQSLRHSEGKKEMHINEASKVAQSVGTKKQTLLSPSLKRKTLEGSNADPVSLYPLKRTTESPNRSRKRCESSQRVEAKQVGNSENLVDCYTKNVLFHPTSTLDVPRESCVMEIEVPMMMENDGNVEKAESCSKELEDIYSMLKKKHEEAKELLVRALVTNNNLLMLNHPIYEEKIRTIQKFATRLMSKELQT